MKLKQIIKNCLLTGVLAAGSVCGYSSAVTGENIPDKKETKITLEEKDSKLEKKVDEKEPYQTSSGAIIDVKVTYWSQYRGKGCLSLKIEAKPDDPKKDHGEWLLDLRKAKNYESSKPLVINKDEKGNVLGVDLSGKYLATLLYDDMAVYGLKDIPNGLQWIAKSVKIVDGKEKWSNYYSKWIPITQPTLIKKQRRPTSVTETRYQSSWQLIYTKLPESVESKEHRYDYKDDDFDPKNVALIGIKYFINKHYNRHATGTIYLDDLGFMDIITDAKKDFEFRREPCQGILEWRHFIKRDTPREYKESCFSDKKYHARAENKVIFPFEDLVEKWKEDEKIKAHKASEYLRKKYEGSKK